MEYSFYRESRHHYLTIPCPEVENYQYRMLAANRMESLIPSSIRRVDGKRYLYYDITARENMEEFFRGHGSAAQEIPRLLYAIADAGVILERYLLDSSRLLLAPEFVFYDYTRNEFSFIYYPEDQEAPTGPAFYEYLADRANPQDKMLYYTLLRLISISANRTYVLEERFLENSLGRKRPQEAAITMEEPVPHSFRTEYSEAGTMTPNANDREEIARSVLDADGGAVNPPGNETASVGTEMPGEQPNANKKTRHLILWVIAALVLLAAAIGLECVRLFMPMDEPYDTAMMAGMIACLAASILTAVYGAYKGVRSSKQELSDVREEARMERRNALTPVDDFQ